MKEIFSDNPVYYFDERYSPITSISPGEKIKVHSLDTYSGQIDTEEVLRSQIDKNRLTPLTGPIFIKGVEPGDSIKVFIDKINLNDKGIMVVSPGMGLLGEHIEKDNTKLMKVYRKEIYFNETIKIPVNPMIGVIGITPIGNPVRAYTPGDFGGNMDCKEITEGSEVHLPVFLTGGLLSLGDLHAIMGDGEMSGTGVEIAGNVELHVEIQKNAQIKRPRVKTKDFWITIASSVTFEDAIKLAYMDMVYFVQKQMNMEFADAYRFVSAVADARISQYVYLKDQDLVSALMTAKVVIPRKLIGL